MLLVGANSLAPNTFVLGIDRERDAMVVHQLIVSGESRTMTGFIVAAIAHAPSG